MTNIKYYSKWTNDELTNLKIYYPTLENSELKKILCHRTLRSIQEMARLMNIKKKDVGKTKRNGDLSVLLNNSLQSLYWIGFIFADGYINHKNGRITISVSEKDKNHLLYLAKYLNSSIRITNHNENLSYNISSCKLANVSISQPQIVREIVDTFDFKPIKTYNPPTIEILDRILNTKEKFLSFFVGFVDGDGCISTNSRGYTYLIVENHASWNKIHNYFISKLKNYGIYNGKSSANINSKNCSKFQLSGIVNSIKIEINKMKLTTMERKWGLPD